jgi:hypothetical protein
LKLIVELKQADEEANKEQELTRRDGLNQSMKVERSAQYV